MRALIVGIALAVLLAGCSDGGSGPPYQGYVEGDYLLIGPKTTGELVSVDVLPGAAVGKDAVLFALDPREAAARVAAAQARLDQAQAQLDNLLTGKRREELSAIEASIEEAQSRQGQARSEFDRMSRLRSTNVISQSQLDSARMAMETTEATVRQRERELESAKLPAREEEIVAARRNVAAAEAQLDEAKVQLADLTTEAPAAGAVEDVYFRPGEVVMAGRPVVSLLPPENRKIRFFIPETALSQFRLGDLVSVDCDGCPGFTARVSFISTEAEYTPPVIFSVQAREKLVFKLEARPEGDGARLKPGQPVDVSPKEPSS